MSATGKIARLPHALREQLNHRLRDAEPAEPLLEWLNALPEVQAILQQQFAGHPINPQNLSEWRTGAFAEWSLRQEIFGALQSADETATAINEMSDHRLAGQLLTLLTARYARFMNRWDGEVTPAINQQLKALSRLTRDLTTLQKAAQRAKSDQIKPNQAIPGVGTARPHITPASAALVTSGPGPTAPIPPTLAFSPQPLDLSTALIKPNQPSSGVMTARLQTSPGSAILSAKVPTKAQALAGVEPALAASVLTTLDLIHETLGLKVPALDLTAGNLDSVLSSALNQTKSKYPRLKMADLPALQMKV